MHIDLKDLVYTHRIRCCCFCGSMSKEEQNLSGFRRKMYPSDFEICSSCVTILFRLLKLLCAMEILGDGKLISLEDD